MIKFMYDMSISNYITIPLSFFIVIFSLLIVQWFMINIINRHPGRISINHPVIFRTMNWWGIFVHELSHAITAILSFHKVEEFHFSSTGGKVVHSSRRKFGFLEWFAAQSISMSPAFVPPVIIAVLLKYYSYIDFSNIIFDTVSFDPINIISSLYLGLIPHIVKKIMWFLINLNYSKVENFILLLILIFSFSAVKPSSIRKDKNGVQGDMQSFIEKLFEFPGYSILFVFFCIAIFWILFEYNLSLFSIILTYLVLLPILSIVSLMFNYFFIRLIDIFDSSSKFHILFSLIGSIFVFMAMSQFTEEQYLINLITVGVLVGLLKLFK